MEYWRREAVEISRARENAVGNRRALPQQAWQELSEEAIEAQFNSMPRANAMQPGMSHDVIRMPKHLREMLNWAEEMKTKHKMN